MKPNNLSLAKVKLPERHPVLRIHPFPGEFVPVITALVLKHLHLRHRVNVSSLLLCFAIPRTQRALKYHGGTLHPAIKSFLIH